MTLASPDIVPPIVLDEASKIAIPVLLLFAAWPGLSVPMRLPRTELEFAESAMMTPLPAETPEITLPVPTPGVVVFPPIELSWA